MQLRGVASCNSINQRFITLVNGDLLCLLYVFIRGVVCFISVNACVTAYCLLYKFTHCTNYTPDASLSL